MALARFVAVPPAVAPRRRPARPREGVGQGLARPL